MIRTIKKGNAEREVSRVRIDSYHRILLLSTCGALLFALACGGSSHSSGNPPPGSNVQAITVDSGPAGTYANGAFTSVIVCAPGTTTCQSIDGVLVDTGSSGLRILSSALSIRLPQQKAGDGNPVVECLPFVSGYTWGPVQTADIEITGEQAPSVPIQVLSNSAFPVPTACADFGTSENTLAALGANGILGVGSFVQDCGGACVSIGQSNLNCITNALPRDAWSPAKLWRSRCRIQLLSSRAIITER